MPSFLLGHRRILHRLVIGSIKLHDLKKSVVPICTTCLALTNAGLDVCRGELIGRTDVDDAALPTRLKR
jgi:hypothetical protein